MMGLFIFLRLVGIMMIEIKKQLMGLKYAWKTENWKYLQYHNRKIRCKSGMGKRSVMH